MQVTITHFGKIKTKNIPSQIAEIVKRLTKFPELKLHFLELKEDNQTKEEDRLRELINKNSDSIFYLMDEFGKEKTSVEFAGQIKTHIKECQNIFFVIGDATGFTDKFKSEFKKENRFALSKMTFTHEVAIYLLTEQIYRSIMIIKGIPYHKE